MNGDLAEADGANGAFSVGLTISGAARRSTLPDGAPREAEAFLHAWEEEIGDSCQPTSSPAASAEFQVKSRALKMRDVAIINVHGVSAVRSESVPPPFEEQVRMFVIWRGSWTRDGTRDRGDQTLSGGQFILEHSDRKSHFETVPHTTAKLFVLPAATLKPLLGNRIAFGSVDSAEMRLLTAHANMVHKTVGDLSTAGVEAARGSLLELAKAVVMGRFDDVEPRLGPALTQAAKDLVNRHLTNPELSRTMLARELNVSVRTLQRAFAAAGETVASYIRSRRLEEARLALAAPYGQLSVSELAAHWQFADSSHFFRAFKKHYGQSPTEYARSTRAARNRTDFRTGGADAGTSDTHRVDRTSTPGLSRGGLSEA
ncbi:helix-turn-helix domain-containing protein [Streptomyces aurantiacus]|uniref:helix-turn-helix domain-containing protein n=1 Tax=Streptomyces aurantiacus TaxID=47760 RepID=UPI0027D8A514|nr:helix-turn-helix domain-containing protein [Streptomyces aurantiacus]